MTERAKADDGKMNKTTWALFIILGAILLATIGAFWLALTYGVVPKISIHGWVAMGVGVTFSLIIGCGLMWLSFYSARQGFDERADPGRLTPRKDPPKH